MTEPNRPRRRLGDRTPIQGAEALAAQIIELRTAAGVPDELNHEDTVRWIQGVLASYGELADTRISVSTDERLNRVGALAVLWAARGEQGVTLAPDYQRGCADAYKEAVTGLRAALGWPAKP